MEPHGEQEEPGAPDADGYIRDTRESDVLCGRGGAALRHPGNQTYRRLVNLNKGLYSTCLKTEKLKISRSIVAAIREQKGRFLEKDTEKDAWVDIGDKKAVEKTSQALREGQPKLRAKIAELGAAAATASPYELASLASGGGKSKDGKSKKKMSPPVSTQEQLQQQRQEQLQQQREQLQQQQAQLQEQQFRQNMVRQQQELVQGQRSGSFDALPPNQSIPGAVPAFQNSANQSMDFRSDSVNSNSKNDRNTRAQDVQPPSPMISASRQADLHADMLQRLTLHDLQTVAAATGNNNNMTFEQQQRYRLRPSLTNTRASLVKELGIVESNISLMSDFSAYGTGASGALHGGISNNNNNGMMGGPSMQSFGNNHMSNINESMGMMSVDGSFKRQLMGMPLGSIHTINTLMSGGTSDQLSVESPSMQSMGGGGGGGGSKNNDNNNFGGVPNSPAAADLQQQFRGTPSGSSQAASAASTAAAANSNASGSNRDFDRRRLFARMKYSRPPSQRQENPQQQQVQQQQQQPSSQTIRNNHNSTGPSAAQNSSHVDALMTGEFHMLESNNMLESNMSLFSAMSNTTGADTKMPAQAAPPGPTKVVVETAKVIDHSQPRQRDMIPFGDVMSSGSRHSIMSGLSRISDTSIDQSIFSDLSKKVGNVSTRSMAMSECSAFDITEGEQDDNDDDFAQGRASIEGGPAESKPEIEFQL